MAGALLVIPLAAMIVPIALILIAVVVDVMILAWMGFRMWHDEWGVRVGDYLSGHVFRPLRGLAHLHR